MVSADKSTLEHNANPSKSPEEGLIDYGVVREDPTLELRVIESLHAELGRPLRTALIASGGCTALAMLSLNSVETVCAIDMNFAQIALVELKRAALAHLTLAEQKLLLGSEKAVRPERIALYEKVREFLPDEVAVFFDKSRDAIVQGLQSNSKLELLFDELRGDFKKEGLSPIDRPSQALGHPAWSKVFARIFPQGRVEQLFGTQAFAYAKKPFHTHLAQSFAKALRREKPSENPFLRHVFSEEYKGAELHLDADAQERIRELGPYRMSTHHGPLIGQLTQLSADTRFDFIQISDVTDWLPTPERHALLRTVKNALNPGGALLARRLNGGSALAPVVREHLCIDAGLSAELREADRSFLYQEVIVARRKD